MQIEIRECYFLGVNPDTIYYAIFELNGRPFQTRLYNNTVEAKQEAANRIKQAQQ